MTPPFIVFMLTFLSFGIVALHSAWRFILREQLPSVVHFGMCCCASYSGWRAFVETEVTEWVPSTPAVLLLVWALASVAAIVLYELRQAVPFDGLFPWWRGDE